MASPEPEQSRGGADQNATQRAAPRPERFPATGSANPAYDVTGAAAPSGDPSGQPAFLTDRRIDVPIHLPPDRRTRLHGGAWFMIAFVVAAVLSTAVVLGIAAVR